MIDDEHSGGDEPKARPWLWVVLLFILIAAISYRYRGNILKCSGGIPESQATNAVATEVSGSEKATDVTPAEGQQNSSSNSSQVVQPQGVPASTNDAAANKAKLVEEARILQEKDSLIEARLKYRQLMALAPDAEALSAVETEIAKINIAMAFTPRPMPEKMIYVVKSGDSVEKIAKKYGSTIDLIKESNGIANPDLIKAGDRLGVLTGKVSIVVDKSSNDLLVRLDGRFFKRYIVGTGKFSKTPAGTFVIADREKEPVWWRPDGKQVPYGDKENILGTRWLSLKATGSTPDVKGYGIHGTWDESAIGKAESAGCIRMKNKEVEELFTLVPIDTVVTITE